MRLLYKRSSDPCPLCYTGEVEQCFGVMSEQPPIDLCVDAENIKRDSLGLVDICIVDELICIYLKWNCFNPSCHEDSRKHPLAVLAEFGDSK